MSNAPELYVTNFNRNFTGVSATIAGVVAQQHFDLRLVGEPLPGVVAPITKAEAFRTSAEPPKGKPFSIWHVRRNTEMRAGIWARDVLRRPVRLVFTSAAQRRHSTFPRWLISRMDAVIATTPEAADFVPHVKAVVPHGVDTDRFTPASDRSTAWANLGYGGARGVACVGRIRAEKGTDRFVDTMLRILPKHKDVTALVIGRASARDQKFLDELKQKVAASELADRLLFVGEVKGEKMPEVMRALSLLVPLPRYEGYGMTPLEGMASAVPFVASDTGYFRAFSAQGRAGMVVEAETAHELVDRLLSDPAKLAVFGEDARRVACESYGINSEAEGIAAVYEGLWDSVR